jgi:hypothetical protein
MYQDRTAWRCEYKKEKNMDAIKDIHKEMLPIWADGVQQMDVWRVIEIFPRDGG